MQRTSHTGARRRSLRRTLFICTLLATGLASAPLLAKNKDKNDNGTDSAPLVTTTDGAVWNQVESDAIRQIPKQGETMKIEARSLGGFMCQPSKYVSFRCYRSK